MTTLPPIEKTLYEKKKRGYFGQLGEGGNARIQFLQTAIDYHELDHIKLIESIPGSDRWDVRDLFQRDVDRSRVEQSIAPYLKDPTKVKFFNPLTLMLLPFDDDDNVLDEVPYVEARRKTIDGHEYDVMEREGLYSFNRHLNDLAFSFLEWNERQVHLVAIDGQHRLTALKDWKSEGDGVIRSWIIPVVILGVFRSSADVESAGLLQIVRNTFVYINSRAERLNKARTILLDDESVNAVVTQVIVQESHRNDCLAPEERNRDKLPLLFFDWRGGTRWSAGKSHPEPAKGTVKSIVEIYDLLTEYILGPDGDSTQEKALGLDDLTPPLASYGEGLALTYEDSERVRAIFTDGIYPGLADLFENFVPYRDYIRQVRQLEDRRSTAADKHAFEKLRFGRHQNVEGELHKRVQMSFAELEEAVDSCFLGMQELIRFDIGMRAIMYAFGRLKDQRDELKDRTSDWLGHSQWFTPILNQIYEDGWFDEYDSLTRDRRELLTHIAFDAAGHIVNYKFADVKKALGTFLALLISKYSVDDKLLEALWDDAGDELSVPLRAGFRKEIRAAESNKFKGTNAEFKAHVAELTEQSVTERIELYVRFLGVEGV